MFASSCFKASFTVNILNKKIINYWGGMKCEILKGSVNVLREIALRRPNAHLAFLRHAPYRNLYNNRGQNAELKLLHGKWVRVNCYGTNGYIFVRRWSTTLRPLTHPQLPHFELWLNCKDRYTLRSYGNAELKYCGYCRLVHLCLSEYIGDAYLEKEAEELKAFWIVTRNI